MLTHKNINKLTKYRCAKRGERREPLLSRSARRRRKRDSAIQVINYNDKRDEEQRKRRTIVSRTAGTAVREEAIINVLEPIKANIDKDKRTRPLRRQKRSAAPKSIVNEQEKPH